MSHFMQYYNYTFTHKCGTHVDLISIINQESLFYKKKIWKNSLFISFTEINDHRGTELLVTFVALFTKLEIKSLLIRRNNIVRCFKRIFKLAWCRENTRSIKMWKKPKQKRSAPLSCKPRPLESRLFYILYPKFLIEEFHILGKHPHILHFLWQKGSRAPPCS